MKFGGRRGLRRGCYQGTLLPASVPHISYMPCRRFRLRAHPALTILSLLFHTCSHDGWVLDPMGMGSIFNFDGFQDLTATVKPAVIASNASDIIKWDDVHPYFQVRVCEGTGGSPKGMGQGRRLQGWRGCTGRGGWAAPSARAVPSQTLMLPVRSYPPPRGPRPPPLPALVCARSTPHQHHHHNANHRRHNPHPTTPTEHVHLLRQRPAQVPGGDPAA